MFNEIFKSVWETEKLSNRLFYFIEYSLYWIILSSVMLIHIWFLMPKNNDARWGYFIAFIMCIFLTTLYPCFMSKYKKNIDNKLKNEEAEWKSDINEQRSFYQRHIDKINETYYDIIEILEQNNIWQKSREKDIEKKLLDKNKQIIETLSILKKKLEYD